MRSSEWGARSNITATVILWLILNVTAASAVQDQQIARKLAALEQLRGKFTFVVMGDNQSGDDTYEKLVAMIVERKPDFVINIGDMIAKPGDKQGWENFWEMSKPIVVPYFLCVGNHDVHSKVAGSEKTYREEVDLPGNELYYSFSAGNSLFIVLDSFLEGRERKITGEQLVWLDGVLANSRQKHKFVFLHHPLYTDPAKGHRFHDSLDKYPESRDGLESLLAKYKVDVVFAGHEHYYERRTVDGIVHVITGGGGARIFDREEDGGFFHFIQITVDGDAVKAQVVDINGKIRDKF